MPTQVLRRQLLPGREWSPAVNAGARRRRVYQSFATFSTLASILYGRMGDGLLSPAGQRAARPPSMGEGEPEHVCPLRERHTTGSPIRLCRVACSYRGDPPAVYIFYLLSSSSISYSQAVFNVYTFR